jgi:alkylation response protein AidB-like acyl-CoA dehydrogenase
LYSLRLSPEQLEIRDTVRSFVTHEIKPVALQADRLQRCERHLPPGLLTQASGIGLRTLRLPEDTGGAGLDALTCCIVLEELAAGDVDLAVSIAHTAHLAPLVFGALSDEQRRRFLPQFVEDPACHLALAAAADDPDARWAYHREIRGRVDCTVTASRASGGDWVLSGAHAFVSNAPIAKWFAVQAKDESDGGLLAFLVARDAAGCAVRDLEADASAAQADAPRGWYHGTAGELAFAKCRIPAGGQLSAAGACGLFQDAGAHGRGMPYMEAVNLGLGRAAFEASVEYAKLRVQGGRTIVGHQAIGTKLADMAIRLEAARKMVWEAAWASDHPEAFADRSLPDLPLQTMAKVYTAEAVHEVTLEAAEVFGAMGVMRDMPMQKYVHDALLFLHAHTSASVERFRVGESVAGYNRT